MDGTIKGKKNRNGNWLNKTTLLRIVLFNQSNKCAELI